MRIDQVLPTFATRDAIGNHTRHVQEAFRAAGIESDIFYLNAMGEVAGLGRHASELAAHEPNRYLLYHSSIGSPVVKYLLQQQDPIIIDYHNITPPEYFSNWTSSTSVEAVLGRSQLEDLLPKTVLALADSQYNERELKELGFANTGVAPLLINLDPDPPLNVTLFEELEASKAKESSTSFLFVGTLAPHKAPHKLIAMLAAYREIYDPNATLTLVGRSSFGDRYNNALAEYVRSLHLQDAVLMPGSLSSADLEAHWRSADVFVCASNHEGFCVPLLEAMSHELPIVAYGSSAIPETLGDAGLVISDPAPIPFAVAAHRVVNDEKLRNEFKKAARAKRASFELSVAKQSFVEAVLVGLERSHLEQT